MNKENYQYYISGAFKLGAGFGIVSLLSRWVTGNTILSSPETLIKYGLTGGIGYSLMGAIALMLFGITAKKIRERYPDHQTLGDVLQEKLHPGGYFYMISLLLLLSIHSLFVQAMGAGILIHMIFPIPIYAGMFLFLFFCFLIGGVGGMQSLHKLSGVNITLIFSAVIIIPVYFFMQEGVYPVYDGIKLFHPYILYVKNTETIYFVLTAVLIGLGQVIIDRATWQRAFIIQKEKVRMTFILSGLIWATIPLALSSLLMIIIFGGSYDTIYSLLFELVERIQSTLLIVLFVLFCFSALSSATSAELHATTTLIVKNMLGRFRHLKDKEKLQYSYWIAGIISLFLLISVSLSERQPIELLFYFGNMYAAIITPMLYIILSKKRLATFVPLISLLGAAGGLAMLPILNSLLSIVVSFAISFVLCVLYFLFESIFSKYKVTNLS